MASIQLIVTGEAELRSLHDSLRRAWPSARRGDPVVWRDPIKVGEPARSRLHALTPGAAPDVHMSKAANMLAQTVLHGVRLGEDAADLVLLVGDVELNNLDQRPRIAEHMRAALDRETSRPGASEALPGALRDRCSYHLLCPMMDALLFGDDDALTRAGVPAHTPLHLADPDVERFEARHPTWNTPDRRHAKKYLQFLAGRTTRGGYTVQRAGDALAHLNWPGVPAHPTATALLRSMFHDLASWFEVQSPLGPGPGEPTTWPPPSSRRLRNL
ncbi:MAG TPA: hypothetical protein PKA64_10065 [Myxococcota bacterium]|nr:hypothetical protein [Myxococcota bacterium]